MFELIRKYKIYFFGQNSRRYRKFPRRLFIQFFLIQIFTYNLLFLSVIAYLKYQRVIDLTKIYEGDEFISFVTHGYLLFFAGSIILASFTSYRFCRPLERLLIKAMRMASKKSAREMNSIEDDIFAEEAGEYSEMDIALDRIERKFKKKKEQLQREREENQAFMASVQEGLVSISTTGHLLYFNSQFASLFIDQKQLRVSHLTGNPLFLSDILRLPEILHAFQQVIDSGENKKVTIYCTTRLDSQPRYFAVSMAPLVRERQKDISSVIGIFHDVTDIKRAEKIRIDFVGNASHELRTPLTSVKGYVETLKEDVAAQRMDQAPKFLGIISRNVDRLIELVNDLLSISSLESDPYLKCEEVMALQISEHVINELAVLAAEKKVVIKVQGDIPPFFADSGKVEQVLRNLVSNAIKYIPEEREVRIKWDLTDVNVVMQVCDNGGGISEEHLPRLFERFYRIDRGRSRDQGGTGLGLAICKHIMISHGGSISVKSELGKGAEFTCYFPLNPKFRSHSPRNMDALGKIRP